MITLHPGQAVLAAQEPVRAITLARLTTYSNRDAETVSERFYWSSIACNMAWPGSILERHEPVLRNVTPIARSMGHIPAVGQLDTRVTVELELDGTEQADGSWLWDVLEAENLLGAQLEVASLLIGLDTNPNDLSDFVTNPDSMAFRFRGEVVEVPAYDDESATVVLIASSLEPALNWPTCDAVDEADLRDLGARYPIPTAGPQSVPLVNRRVGAVTTLVNDLADTFLGNVAISDDEGFEQTGNHYAQIGDETVLWTWASNNIVNILGRGQLGTTATAHGAGSVFVEVENEIAFVASGFECRSLNRLYLIAPTGERVAINGGEYGWNPANDQLDPGRTLGVVTFYREQFQQLLLKAGAEVSQQPTTEQSGNDVILIPIGSYGTIAGHTPANLSEVDLVNDSGVQIGAQSSGGTKEDAMVIWNTSAAVPDQGRVVVRARMVFDIRITADSTTNMTFYWETAGSPLNINQGKQLLATQTAGSGTSYATIASNWYSPANTTLADLVNSSATPLTSGERLIVYTDNPGTTGGGSFFVNRTSYWEVEVLPNAIAQKDPAEVSGGTKYGAGVTLVADLNGVVNVVDKEDVAGIPWGNPADPSWAAANCTLSAGAGTTISCAPIATGFMSLGRAEAFPDLTGQSIYFTAYVAPASKPRLNWADPYAIGLLLVDGSGNSTEYGFGVGDLTGQASTTADYVELCADLTAHKSQRDTGGGVDLTNVTSWQLTAKWSSLGGSDFVNFRGLRTATREFPIRSPDVASWVLQNLARLPSSAIDQPSFDLARANVNANMDLDLRRAGETLPELLSVLGYEARTNYTTAEEEGGTVYRAFAADAGFDWPTPVRTIDTFRRLEVSSRSLEEQPTRFECAWDYLNFQTPDVPTGYRRLSRANEDENDLDPSVPDSAILAAQNRVGAKSAQLSAFRGLNTEAEIERVWGYYVTETLRGKANRYGIAVDYATGYDLEPGDIVELAGLRWTSATVKCRVTQVVFSPSEPEIVLSLEEVT